MIEIIRRRVGMCESCKERPVEYTIEAAKGEWDEPKRLCQPCMMPLAENNKLIRGVLLLQAATRG
jgi:hypothetical protein